MVDALAFWDLDFGFWVGVEMWIMAYEFNVMSW